MLSMLQPKELSRTLSSVVCPPGERVLGAPHSAVLVFPDSGSVYAFASTLDQESTNDAGRGQRRSENQLQNLQGAWMGNYVPVPDSIRGLMVAHDPSSFPSQPSGAHSPRGVHEELEFLTGEERVHALAAVSSLSWRQAMDQLLARQAGSLPIGEGPSHSRTGTPRAAPRSRQRDREGAREPDPRGERQRERDRTPTGRGRGRSGTQTSTTLLSESSMLPPPVRKAAPSETDLRSRALGAHPSSPPPSSSAPPTASGFAAVRDSSPSAEEDVLGPILHPGMVVPSTHEVLGWDRDAGASTVSGQQGCEERGEPEDAPATIVPLLNTYELGAVLTLPLGGRTDPIPPLQTHGAQTPGSVSNSHHSAASGGGGAAFPPAGRSGDLLRAVPHPVFLLVLNCDMPKDSGASPGGSGARCQPGAGADRRDRRGDSDLRIGRHGGNTDDKDTREEETIPPLTEDLSIPSVASDAEDTGSFSLAAHGPTSRDRDNRSEDSDSMNSCEERQEEHMWQEMNARAQRLALQLFEPIKQYAAGSGLAYPNPPSGGGQVPRPPTTAGSPP